MDQKNSDKKPNSESNDTGNNINDINKNKLDKEAKKNPKAYSLEWWQELYATQDHYEFFEQYRNHMLQENQKHLLPEEIIHFQKPGWRILKTTIAVFICLMISLIDVGDNLGIFHAFQACFAAIITLKSDLKHTWQAGLTRVFSTGLGAMMGLITMQAGIALHLETYSVNYYLIITVMTFLTIWLTVLFKAPDSTALAAVVLILISLSQPSTTHMEPVKYAFLISFLRFSYTIVGIVVAYFVNWALPPYHNKKFRNS